jgi:dihydrofolate reductase
MNSRQPIFDLVVARSINFGIGLNNTIPWKLPSDLKMFKKITTSGALKNAVIMGRKTFDSIGKKALPNRTNIIISQNSKIEQNENLKQAGSLDEALQLAKHIN